MYGTARDTNLRRHPRQQLKAARVPLMAARLQLKSRIAMTCRDSEARCLAPHIRASRLLVHVHAVRVRRIRSIREGLPGAWPATSVARGSDDDDEAGDRKELLL